MSDLDPVVVDLIARRLGLGFSQRELARQAGIAPATLCTIEQGARSPTLTTLRKLAVALGRDVRLALPLEPERCPAEGPQTYPYRCVRSTGHDGQHGYAGVFWS